MQLLVMDDTMTANAGNVPNIFDTARLKTRLQRTVGVPNFYIEHLLMDASERLSTITRDFEKVLIIVPDPQSVAKKITAIKQIKNTEVISLGQYDDGVETLRAKDTDYDLILCLGILQIINDLPGMLVQIRQHLVADGLFLGAMMGGQTLSELRQSFLHAELELRGGTAPRVAPFVDVRDAGSLLQRAGFALPVSDSDRLTVRYDSMLELAVELRGFGASNPLVERDDKLMTRTLLANAGQHYADTFSDSDGRIRASLETIWMSGWTPHESQQQPLKPGSAKMRLADALKTRETKL